MQKKKFRPRCRLFVENEPSHVTPLPGAAYLQKLMDIVGSAQSNVDIMMYQWVWYPSGEDKILQQFNRALVGLLKRGVRFRVIMNIESHGHKLTRENVNTAEILKSFGAKVKFGPKFPTTHGKMFIVDEKYVFLGSHNLSQRAVTVNDEVSVMVQSNKVCAEYKRYFDTMWNRI